MEKVGMDVHNEFISRDIIGLAHRFGNLFIHVTGEGKIDFRGALGSNSAWVGMTKAIISGDMGCMTPYDGYDTCALDNALDFLYNLEAAPHLNSSLYEEYVPSSESWQKFVDNIKQEQKELTPSLYLTKYSYTLFSDEDPNTPVATVTLEPLCNEFVIGEFNAASKCEFIGVLEDYDQPRIKEAVVTINGDDIWLTLDRIIHFRHRKYQPRKGDYLLRDNEQDFYLILPQEDYSIH